MHWQWQSRVGSPLAHSKSAPRAPPSADYESSTQGRGCQRQGPGWTSSRAQRARLCVQARCPREGRTRDQHQVCQRQVTNSNPLRAYKNDSITFCMRDGAEDVLRRRRPAAYDIIRRLVPRTESSVSLTHTCQIELLPGTRACRRTLVCRRLQVNSNWPRPMPLDTRQRLLLFSTVLSLGRALFVSLSLIPSFPSTARAFGAA
jgi:hypothetical protein